jgi:hypothetical protein
MMSADEFSPAHGPHSVPQHKPETMIWEDTQNEIEDDALLMNRSVNESL